MQTEYPTGVTGLEFRVLGFEKCQWQIPMGCRTKRHPENGTRQRIRLTPLRLGQSPQDCATISQIDWEHLPVSARDRGRRFLLKDDQPGLHLVPRDGAGP